MFTYHRLQNLNMAGTNTPVVPTVYKGGMLSAKNVRRMMKRRGRR